MVGAGATVGEGTEIGAYAVIGEGARIGRDCIIHPHAVVGPGVEIGDGCRLHAHSSVSHAVLGRGVVLHPGARVGQEGFGFAPTAEGRFETMPQLGRVVLGDGVEIGANSCVDRGAQGDTVLGPGTRLDNLVQVGHNVRTGRGCILVAQSGVSGSTVLGDFVTVAAQAGLTGHLRVGAKARIGAQAGVMNDVPAGTDVLGSPAWPVRQTWRAIAHLRRIGARRAAARARRTEGDGRERRERGGGRSGAAATTVESFDIAHIMRAIPHRYPFLLVDRIVDVVKGVSAIGVKNVSINENFFQGHFPAHPVMPGVLIIESMAQTAAVLVVETLGPEARGKLVYFMSVEGAKFRRPVVPGDQMRVHVVKDRQRGNIWKFRGDAKVDGKTVAEATYSAMILDK